MRKWRFAAKLFAWALTLVMLAGVIPIRTQAATVYVERKADVVFVIDATGSMGGCISSVKANITTFLNLINREDVDVRVKFVVYRDMTMTGDTKEASFQSDWYAATDASSAFLTDVDAYGGGDEVETLLDGIGMMLTNSFRSDAVKYCVYFTDAPTKTDNNYGYTSETDALAAVNNEGIVMSMVTRSDLFDSYAAYVSSDKGGMIADIYGDYSILLKELADTIIGELDKLGTLTMNPRNCKEGEEVTVRVTSNADSGITYESDFSVLFDGAAAEVTATESNYFEFKVPTGKVLGKYDVNVVNGGENTLVGHFLIESGAEYGAMSPASTIKGTAVTVRVPVSKLNYQSDFKITMGGKKVSVSSKQTDYFEFKVPSSLAVKSYDVVLTNGGQNTYIGDFNVNPKIPSFGSMNPTEGIEGKNVTVKVPVSNIDYADDFAVTMNGTAVKFLQYNEYISFTVPKTMSAGSYEVEIKNADSIYDIGTYTVNAKEPLEVILGAMDVTETIQGTPAKVTVTKTNMEYADDFNVKVGTTSVNSLPYEDYFTFTVPKTMAEGSYEVVVTNNSITYNLGTFTVKPKEDEDKDTVVLGPMSITECLEGKTATVKVSQTNMTYKGDFVVKMNGTKVNSLQYNDYFTFTVNKKMVAGSYEVVVMNNSVAYNLGTFTIKPKVVLEPTFSMKTTESLEGKTATVKVDCTNFTGASNLQVKMNDSVVKCTNYGSYFSFTVPKTMTAGSYEVTVINNSSTYTLGTYTVKARVVLTPTFSMNSTSSEEGKTATVKVTCTNFTAASDLTVKMGASVVKNTSYGSYFSFTVPKTMTAGSYEVTVINNSTTYTLGTYVVKAKEVPEVVLGNMSVTEGEEGKNTTVKVTKSNMDYVDDFAVTMNGTAVNYLQYNDYFTFTVPKTMAAGSYAVVMINNGVTYSLGSYTIKAKETVAAMDVTGSALIVAEEALVSEESAVTEEASVSGESAVTEEASVSGESAVTEEASVSEESVVTEDASVSEESVVTEDASSSMDSASEAE